MVCRKHVVAEVNTKGVLLCGGEGTRLRPLTEVVNKHLVRVLDRPMAEYPLLKMVEAGIKEILIVTGGENFAGVCKYFGSGSKWAIKINYAIQDKAGGIAEALSLAKTFVGNSNLLVCLGDNIWNMNISEHVDRFPFCDCVLFTIITKTPERFGVIKYEHGIPVDVIEKPKDLVSTEAVAGIYCYKPDVFNVINDLKPSARGELEISDVNRHYVKGKSAHIVAMTGWWSDCGSVDTLLQAEELLRYDGRPVPPLRTKRGSRSRK